MPDVVVSEQGKLTLKTLGELKLLGSDFARPKPLLLLAYLALEGPQERRHLAELFWPDNADALNSLSVSLSRIRQGAKEAVEADEVRVWSRLETDVQAMAKAIEAQQWEAALDLYCGPFLDGVYLPDWGAELEEWVYAKREAFANKARAAHLTLAEQAASKGNFERAAKHAESAYLLKAAPEPEPEELRRLYALLLVGGNAHAHQVKREAAELGIGLNLKPEEARARLKRELLGREDELQTLQALPAGAWAWVHGGAGMGKTALLKALPGQYLPGRSGLPYATLEPLLGETLSEGEGMLLRRLVKLEETLLIDDWEDMDPESQALLRRLQGLKPAARVLIASREAAAFEVDLVLELGPIEQATLSGHPGVWEATGGLPALVEAFLKGKPVGGALETRLAGLSKSAREVCLALCLLEQPDLALVRKALELTAATMGQVLDELYGAGWVEASGQVRARHTLEGYLQGRQNLGAGLAVKLARLKEGVEAFGLWHRGKVLWEEGDLGKVQKSYIAWAEELLRRGFPSRVNQLLDEIPQNLESLFLRARALERAGKYNEALDLTDELLAKAKKENQKLHDYFSLRSVLLWRTGHYQEAQEIARRALDGSMEAKALAQNTLGHLALSSGNFPEAERQYERAANSWLAVGQRERWVEALNNQAVASSEMGQHADSAFQKALHEAEDFPLTKARILINIGKGLERKGKYAEAVHTIRQVVELAEELGSIQIAASGWNNLGFSQYLSRQLDEARDAYSKALDLSHIVGDKRMIGVVLSNLAMLNDDFEAWREAIQYLEESGFQALANERKQIMEKRLMETKVLAIPNLMVTSGG